MLIYIYKDSHRLHIYSYFQFLIHVEYMRAQYGGGNIAPKFPKNLKTFSLSEYVKACHINLQTVLCLIVFMGVKSRWRLNGWAHLIHILYSRDYISQIGN